MTHVLINAENFLTKVYKVQVIGTTYSKVSIKRPVLLNDLV